MCNSFHCYVSYSSSSWTFHKWWRKKIPRIATKVECIHSYWRRVTLWSMLIAICSLNCNAFRVRYAKEFRILIISSILSSKLNNNDNLNYFILQTSKTLSIIILNLYKILQRKVKIVHNVWRRYAKVGLAH